MTQRPIYPTRDLQRHLDELIDTAITTRRLVGCVVLITHDGELLYRRAAGMADREAARPMSESNLFQFTSLTKPLVAAVTLRLVEEGKISLDDPVTRWLPDFRPRLADGHQPTITLHQLLTHTAGLTYGFLQQDDGPYRRAQISDGFDLPGLSLEENLRRIASVPLSYPPGTAWGYSVAFDVLGGVLSAATGESLPQLLQTRLTAPLGMVDTAFAILDHDRLAVPYADGNPEPLRMQGEIHLQSEQGCAHFAPERLLDPASYPSGGAGMVGTATDFMRFLLALQRQGEPILAPASVARMLSDWTGPLGIVTREPGWGNGYGWARLDDPQPTQTPQSAGTIKWGGAYGHSWFYDPQQKLAAVALTNTTFEGVAGDFPRAIRDGVYAAL